MTQAVYKILIFIIRVEEISELPTVHTSRKRPGRNQAWLQNTSFSHYLANGIRLTLVSQSCPCIVLNVQNGNSLETSQQLCSNSQTKGTLGPGAGALGYCRHHFQPPVFVAYDKGEITKMTVKNPVKTWAFNYDICYCIQSLTLNYSFLGAIIKRVEWSMVQIYIWDLWFLFILRNMTARILFALMEKKVQILIHKWKAWTGGLTSKDMTKKTLSTGELQISLQAPLKLFI